MSRSIQIVLITFISFGLYFVLDDLYFGDLRNTLNSVITQLGISHILTYVIIGIPILAGAIVIHGRKDLADGLGLDRPILEATWFALLCTVPMLIGYACVFDLNTDFSINTLLISAIASAFFEELYFRSFLFGQLFRFTRLGFIPAVVLGAILFASVHMYQSDDLVTLGGIFLTTLLGGVLFAWVYVEWDYNLWVPVFLHLFMNLFWDLFSVSDNALGSTYANVFRSITILAIIGLTVLYKIKNGRRVAINRDTIWMKKGRTGE